MTRKRKDHGEIMKETVKRYDALPYWLKRREDWPKDSNPSRSVQNDEKETREDRETVPTA